jgi:predicted HTH transcriptional regulator
MEEKTIRKNIKKDGVKTIPKTIPKTMNFAPKSREKVLMYMKDNPQITMEHLAELLDMSVIGIKYITKQLQNENIIIRVGAKKGGHWEVIK